MSARQRRRKLRRQEDRRHGATPRQALLGTGLALGATLGVAPTAHADVETFVVNRTSDEIPAPGDCMGAPNDCSLRQAIFHTNDGDPSTDQDRIVFASSISGQTITLQNGELGIYEPVYVGLGGAGYATAMTVNAGDSSRIFYLDTASGAQVTLSGLTLTGGYEDKGGAIYASGPDLSVQNSTITGNAAGSKGGGAYLRDATVTFEDSDISGNDGGDYGGGIYAFGGSTTLQDSTVSENDALYKGGGVYGRGYNTGVTVRVLNSTVSGNRAGLGPGNFIKQGGGIQMYSYGQAGTLDVDNAVVSGNTVASGVGSELGGGVYAYNTTATISESAIAGNTASDYGGGIYKGSGDIAIERSTISGNSVTYGGGGGAWLRNDNSTIEASTIYDNYAADYGGGVRLNGTHGTIRDSTISGNSAGLSGGGVYNDDYDQTLSNTIVAGNDSSSGGADLFSYPGYSFSTDFSLIEDPSDGNVNATVAGSNLLGVDPQLGALADNASGVLAGAPPGDLVQTLALQSTSPAVDAGKSGLTSDQRWLLRPVNFAGLASSAAGANCADIGAFELQLPGGGAGATCGGSPTPPPSPAPTSMPTGSTFNLKKAIKKCKKKFRVNRVKRKKCIKRAKKRARG